MIIIIIYQAFYDATSIVRVAVFCSWFSRVFLTFLHRFVYRTHSYRVWIHRYIYIYLDQYKFHFRMATHKSVDMIHSLFHIPYSICKSAQKRSFQTIRFSFRFFLQPLCTAKMNHFVRMSIVRYVPCIQAPIHWHSSLFFRKYTFREFKKKKMEKKEF